MELVYCPNCGTVYIYGTTSCQSKTCQPSEEWIPPKLEYLPIDNIEDEEYEGLDIPTPEELEEAKRAVMELRETNRNRNIRPLQVGDKVKVVKWRDGGWTGEVHYEGIIEGYDEEWELYKVKLTRPSPESNGWKRGQVYNERREDLIER